MAQANVKAELIHLIAPFMAKKDVRYYLNGIAIQPAPEEHGGVYIVATDSHALGVFHDPTGYVDEPIIVAPGKDTLKACKAPKSEGGERRFAIGDTFQQVEHRQEQDHGDRTTAIVAEPRNLIDGRFPDWTRVVPDELPSGEGAMPWLNHWLLKKLERVAASAYKNPQSEPIRIYHEDENAGAVVLTGRHDFAAVIMPARDDLNRTMPQWLKGRGKVQES